MKGLKIFGILVIAICAMVVFGTDPIKDQIKIHDLQAENNAWRQAARPIFQSRGTYDITDHATPQDLTCYLDKKCAVVWQEHSMVQQGLSPNDPVVAQFLGALPSKDATLWKLLAGKAAEVPDANAFEEYASTSTGKSVPILVNVRGESGEFYTVVVGVHVYGQSDPVGYVLPRLAYYVSSEEGMTRVSSIAPRSAKSDGGIDRNPLRESIERHLRQQLFGVSS